MTDTTISQTVFMDAHRIYVDTTEDVVNEQIRAASAEGGDTRAVRCDPGLLCAAQDPDRVFLGHVNRTIP